MRKHDFIKFSSGFYGSKKTASEAVISPFREETVARIQYDSTIFNRNPKKTIILNRTVADLHDHYMASPATFLRRFDNRSEIMVQALKSFGWDFTDWYLLHGKDPAIDTNLIEFIEDTCRFLMTGERKYPVQSWKEMVGMTSTPYVYREVPPYISALTGVVSYNQPTSQRRLTKDVVQLWQTRPEGITDMLLSLQIMFGPVQFKS